MLLIHPVREVGRVHPRHRRPADRGAHHRVRALVGPGRGRPRHRPQHRPLVHHPLPDHPDAGRAAHRPAQPQDGGRAGRPGAHRRRHRAAPAPAARPGKVDIGTGGGGRGESLVLDALSRGPAGQLRAELLHRRTATAPAGPSAAPAPSGPVGPEADGPRRKRSAAGARRSRGGRPAPPRAWTPWRARAGPARDRAAAAGPALDRLRPVHPQRCLTALAVVGVALRLVDQLDIDAARLPAVRA